MTVERFLELIFGNAGVIFLLLVILWSGFRGYWVFGKYYDAQTERIKSLEARLDRAGRVAEGGTGLARRAVDVVDRHTGAPDA